MSKKTKTPEKKQDDKQSDQDKALARKWGQRLSRALEAQTKEKVEERLKKLRKYVRGQVGEDDAPGLVRTNIVHSNFAAILPQVYAKNPEIAVSPSEAADNKAYAWVGPFCKTMQAVLNRVFIRDGKLKKRAKSAIRSSMTTAVGWVKMAWQKDIKRDPLLENRISDAQDNLQRIRALIADIEDGDESRGELEVKEAELNQQLAALQAQAEVSVSSGIVIDRVLTEDMFILDDTLYDFDGYEQADALAHRVWMTTDRYKETFGKEAPKTANRYGKDKKERGAAGDDGKVELVAVFEVWDKVSNSIYTLCAGADEWARDPYAPTVIGERFYPFFALAFNPVDGSAKPLSDTELLIELQDEYNTTRTNFAEHRKENLPVRVYRKGGDLTDADVKALSNRQSGQWVGIEGNPDQPIEKDIAILQNPPVDPATYDVQPILRDAEMVLGAGDAAKGTINKAKTATEAEIMAQGLQSRVAERQDVVEDWISEMAQYAAEICLQEMTLPQVQRIAGANAVWPKFSKEQVFDLVSIDIRAGSTGKPNRNKEREQWAQMLPQIQQAVQTVMQLRQGGQNDMAETVIKLLEETLRRFDDRIDIEQFMPQKEEGNEPQEIPQEIQQQIQQGQQMIEQLQQENQQLKQAAQDKAGAQARQAVESEQARIQHEKYLMNPSLADAERQESVAAQQEQRAMMQQLGEALSVIGQSISGQQQVMAALGEHIAAVGEAVQSGNNSTMAAVEQMAQVIATRMSAPKRVLRDDEGNLIGVETVQ